MRLVGRKRPLPLRLGQGAPPPTTPFFLAERFSLPRGGSTAPLGAGGTAPYDPVFFFAAHFAAAKGVFVPPLSRRRFHRVFPLPSTSFFSLVREKPSTALRGSCFLPRFHSARIGAFAAAAAELSPLPSPVGERGSGYNFGFAKRKDSRLLNVSLVQITSTPTTSPLQVIGEWTDGARLIRLTVYRTAIVPQLRAVVNTFLEVLAKSLVVLLCADSHTTN